MSMEVPSELALDGVRGGEAHSCCNDSISAAADACIPTTRRRAASRRKHSSKREGLYSSAHHRDGRS
jgi:hypothetical protein